jgi:probable F420-dependent oxidoreductase
MKFGLPLFGVKPADFAAVAQAAETAGFESLWIPEHLVFPAEMPATYPYTETGQPPVFPGSPLYDPWVTLAYMAAATERIRLGTQVYILPLRHPLVTARAFTTLDVLSRGRAVLGIGVGWMEEEFELAGQEFATRGSRTDEIIEILHRLWTEKEIHHRGTHYDLGPLRFEPKPAQKPHPPIEVGGASPAALRRAARLGDGWQAIGDLDVEAIGASVKGLEEMGAKAGRTGPFEITTPSALGATLDAVRRYEDVGVTRLSLGPPFRRGMTVEDVTDFLARTADEVIAKA